MTRFVAVGCLVLLGLAVPARARQVDVPLQYDYDFIRQALAAQIYTGPNGKAVLWDDGTGCGFLKLRDPQVSGTGDRIRIISRGEARVGTPFGDACLAPVQWEGFLELFEQPQISDDQRELRFRVVESNIYNQEMKKPLLTGKIWDLVKDRAQLAFETVRIDLNPVMQDIRGFLPLVVGRGDQARIEQMLDSLRLTDARAADAGVKVTLAFAVSDVPPAAAPTPEPTLTSEELQRWEQALRQWDAFVTFVTKQLGSESSTQDLRQAFFNVLVDSRYDVLEALAPTAPGAPDPTRELFLKTWERLVPVVRRSASTMSGNTAMRYLGFIAAGDALATLDEIGPVIGVEISADGLRRLARMAAPMSTEDPLAYNEAVDPQLRDTFGFGAPLPPPDLSAEPIEEETPAAVSFWNLLLRSANAAAEAPAPKTLERWAPPDADSIDAYLQAVREVLEEVTQKSLASGSVPPQHQQLYRHLVLATAWQESCWRQFVRSRGKITFMRSVIGSTGIMQINERVWRGFYDLRGLRWDIRYNSRAGSEILLRYLKDYAIPHDEPGVTDFLARATYAVYNGGPGHLRRFLQAKGKKTLKRIDDLFYQKLKGVVAGNNSGLVRCIVGGAPPEED